MNVGATDEEIAIAIKYDTDKDSAPRVVAKGMRIKVEKIREIAKANNIKNPDLIFAHTEIYIPER